MLERLGKAPIAAPRMHAPLKGIQPAWAPLVPNECLGCQMVTPGTRSGSENSIVQNKKKGGGKSHKWLLPLVYGRELCRAQHCSQMLLIKCSFLRPGEKKPKTSSLFPLHKEQMLLGRALASSQHSPGCCMA